MAKQKCPECEKCLPAWLAAFGDLMSLLLCFFVLLLSMSTMDSKKFEEVVGSLAGALSILDGGAETELDRQAAEIASPSSQTYETTETIKKVSEIITEFNEMIESAGGPPVTLKEAEEGFIIRLPAKLLFSAGNAQIENEDAFLFLKRVALIVRKLPQDMGVKVIGHTDDGSLSSDSIYRDNWGLSTARAISVTKELIKNNIQAKRIMACGNAQYKPVASNETPEGRAKNRRVELHFFANKSDMEKKVEKSILDLKSNE